MRIVYICKKLGIHDEISKLKYGYDTVLNSNDDKLSANSKILLNIARILLKNTKIMIFDEIICSLNKDSRNTVLEIFNDLKERFTIIIIDKNEDVLKMSDNIVLFNDGLVSDCGEYDNVSQNKLYKKIVSN